MRSSRRIDLVMKGEAVEIENAIAMPGGVLRLRDGVRVDTLPGYDDGAWWVQDFAATLPARLLGDVRDQRVIDLCAAPGGKTAELIARGARGHGGRARAGAHGAAERKSRAAET